MVKHLHLFGRFRRDDLEWKYHPDTDTSTFPEGHEKLDANDWLWTWKHALSVNWFRARTGGGDFISKGVKGAKAYMENPTEANWENVGLKVVDGNTLQIEYNEPIAHLVSNMVFWSNPSCT